MTDAKKIAALEAEVERQTTECIKRGFEVESLMTEVEMLKATEKVYRMNRDWIEDAKIEISQLKLMAEVQNEVARKLALALERAKDVIDFCYMNQPKNKHQVEIEKALAEYQAALEGK